MLALRYDSLRSDVGVCLWRTALPSHIGKKFGISQVLGCGRSSGVYQIEPRPCQIPHRLL